MNKGVSGIGEQETNMSVLCDNVNDFADVFQTSKEVSNLGILPGQIRGSNTGYATFIGQLLACKFGVRPDISLGYAGMGLTTNSDLDNESGKFLTRSEVIRRIRSAMEASKN